MADTCVWHGVGVLRFGVEEEFHLLDAVTWRSTAAAIPVLRDVGDGHIVPELKQSVVETNSGVFTDLSELQADLARLRRELEESASAAGIAILATGSAPLVDRDAASTYPKDRYQRMTDAFEQEAREQLVCGLQTQIEIRNGNLAVEVINRARRWVPLLLALAASSPFWFTEDTGWSSWRTHIWQRWPSTGMPDTFADAADYDATVRALQNAGVILDPGMVYFDIRRSAHNPTVEFRICDATPDVADAAALAGLTRALVDTIVTSIDDPDDPPRMEMLRAARWQAARWGVTADLIDPLSWRPVPAAGAIDHLLDFVGPALRSAGDFDAVSAGLSRLMSDGGCAGWQRRQFNSGESLSSILRTMSAKTVVKSQAPPQANRL